jgi:hypothetical protein
MSHMPERIEIGLEPGITFELAGPRAKLFFDPKQTWAGIVTCGGLCGASSARFPLLRTAFRPWSFRNGTSTMNFESNLLPSKRSFR